MARPTPKLRTPCSELGRLLWEESVWLLPFAYCPPAMGRRDMELQIKKPGGNKQIDHLASKTILNTPTTYLSLPLRADLNPSGIYLVPDFTGTVVQSTRSELLLLSHPQRNRLAPIFPKGLNLTLTGC